MTLLLKAALERGLADANAGRVRPLDEVKPLIPGSAPEL